MFVFVGTGMPPFRLLGRPELTKYFKLLLDMSTGRLRRVLNFASFCARQASDMGSVVGTPFAIYLTQVD